MEKALSRLDESITPEVSWSAFELNPNMPTGGMDRRAYRTAKFGSLTQSEQLDANVSEAGRSEGIEFKFSKINRTPNTFAAHRLIWLARREGLENAVVEELFLRYFVEGEDIGDAAKLAAIAAHCGLEENAAWEFLKSSEGVVEVRRESEAARSSGISGVPTFILNDRHSVSGAQPPQILSEAFGRCVD